jgi:DNA polymerase III alpha subunit
MYNDQYGRQVLTEIDICNLYLKDPDIILNNVLIEKPIHFDDNLNISNAPTTIVYKPENISINSFDELCQNSWFIPNEYIKFDIAKYVLDLCANDVELQRVGAELLLYQERDMFPLLRYCKYLVDMMRKNNIVWGVGRGSSISSYVLFLIGIHKIDSIYYDLDINEFLK